MVPGLRGRLVPRVIDAGASWISRNHDSSSNMSALAANGVVAPVHAKAMPVILRNAEECDAWLTADQAEALTMQRPLPDDALMIVATGEKEDPPPAPAPREDMPAASPELPL